MRHIPHLHLPPPWPGSRLDLSDQHRRHLHRVLRLSDGATVSYTDGTGTMGSGVLEGDSVVRGPESRSEPAGPEVAVAVAPPHRADRGRFIVEKLAELGVDRLIWLRSRHGEGRPPHPDKAAAWASAALEQSRGAWVMRLEGPVAVDDLPSGPSKLWVAERGAASPPSVVEGGILLIGPEAGFAEGEIPAGARPIGLGSRVLRVETAAVVGAALLLDRVGRLEA